MLRVLPLPAVIAAAALQTHNERQHGLGGGAVGVMHEERPAQPLGNRGNLSDGRFGSRSDIERFAPVLLFKLQRRLDERLGRIVHINKIAQLFAVFKIRYTVDGLR